ncbi:PTB domain-containing adapter protein ced-6 isoform X2 [Lingula anatina]|uniref:PTB domain-containing adapter protein ced-6 isoform X2 n=1 Tax=Lingula anatina TaxID=7574 RepID=A0A1S3H0D7_LINAN|nr:PTB domain-containing adapter protein ced-6 isoform X2 [Lingula anatina]|eukprot:XP_013378941.1 PTB domain-containing adapter protein ced-6 isoform X2 [Lingula anatina]
MNRQTSFARWVQGQKENQSHSRNMNKQWVHPPEALLRGHIVYNVKYLGGCGVETAKGSDVVKDAIRKMKFNKQLKKSEGIKPAKVELTISVDGVTIQDPKTKIIKHQYPLHRISYCADDKSDKRMFTFIAKEADSQDHTCHVFDSEKCSEEITLTVGQAFDLAYRKFLESSGRDMDLKKQFLLLQKKVQALSHENQELKTRIQELEGMKDRDEIQRYMEQNHIRSLGEITPSLVFTEGKSKHNGETNAENNHREVPTVGRRLEGLIFEDDFVPQTNGSATPNTSQSSPSQLPILSPPPSTGKRPHHGTPTSPASTSNNQGTVYILYHTPTSPASTSNNQGTVYILYHTDTSPASTSNNQGTVYILYHTPHQPVLLITKVQYIYSITHPPHQPVLLITKIYWAPTPSPHQAAMYLVERIHLVWGPSTLAPRTLTMLS